jgi:hypothetical protein
MDGIHRLASQTDAVIVHPKNIGRVREDEERRVGSRRGGIRCHRPNRERGSLRGFRDCFLVPLRAIGLNWDRCVFAYRAVTYTLAVAAR